MNAIKLRKKATVLMSAFAMSIIMVGFSSCQVETLEADLNNNANHYILDAYKANFKTAVAISGFKAGDDITDKVVGLKSKELVDEKVIVRVVSVGDNGLFSLQDGKIMINKMPTIWSDGDLSPSEVPNNLDVVTLELKQGNETTTVDVLVVLRVFTKAITPIVTWPFDSVRVIVPGFPWYPIDPSYNPTNFTYNHTYLGLGYDMINSAYLSVDGVKKTNPILDIDKLNASGVIRQEEETGNNFRHETAETVDSLYSLMYAKANVKADAGIFSGKASLEFKSEKDSYQTNLYTKIHAWHFTTDEYIRGTLPTTLKKYLSDGFIYSVNNQTAAKILDTYGTHLLKRVYHGGVAEVNVSYFGSRIKSTKEMSTSIEASYGKVFSGDASYKNDQKYLEIRNNSSFYCNTRGSSELVSVTSMEDFAAKYPIWVNGIRKTPRLCGYSNFDDAFMPIWELIETINPTKANQVKAEYYQRLERQRSKIVYKPGYITALNAWAHGGNSSDFKSVYSREYTLVYRGVYGHDDSDVDRDLLDANAGAGGAWIRIGYVKESMEELELFNRHRNAIEDIIVLRSLNEPVPYGYKRIDLDLNQGAGGKCLLLAYKKVTPYSKQAITYIGSYASSNNSSDEILNSWSWVKSSVGVKSDLNEGSGGEWIYLTMKKIPFKW